MMDSWSAPQRPAEYAEQSLVEAILDGSFAAGSALPGERTLAVELGVTRPTLREAIQRLARDGWLTVQQGKPTQVNNFWQEGGLNVLSTLVHHSDHLPPNFIAQLLEIRLHLAPAYTYAAVVNDATPILILLNSAATLSDTAAAFANFDWQLHHQLTISSGNPIFTLILNGFADFYERIALLYFTSADSRDKSRAFYAALATAVANHDSQQAEQLSRAAMQESLAQWSKHSESESEG